MSSRRTNGRIDDDDDFGGVEVLDDENKLSQSQINDLKDEVKRGLTLIDGCVNQLAQAKWILINVEKTLNSKGNNKKGGVSSAKKGKPTPPAPTRGGARAPPASKKTPAPKSTPASRSTGGGSKRTAASKRSRPNYMDKYHDILNGERNLKVVLEAIDHLVGNDSNFKGWDLERIEMEIQEAVSKVNSSSTNHHTSSYNNDDEDDELFSAPKEKKTKDDTSSLFDNLLKKTPDFKEKLRATFLNFSQTAAGTDDDTDMANEKIVDDEEEKENADDEPTKPPEDFKEKLRMAFAGFVSTTTKTTSSDDEGAECKSEDVKMNEEPEEIDNSLMEIADSINMDI